MWGHTYTLGPMLALALCLPVGLLVMLLVLLFVLVLGLVISMLLVLLAALFVVVIIVLVRRLLRALSSSVLAPPIVHLLTPPPPRSEAMQSNSTSWLLRSMALRTTSSLSAWRSGIFSSKEAIELTCHMLTLVREHLTPDVVVDSKLSHALWNEIMELSTISCSSKIAPWTSLGGWVGPTLT